MSTALRRWSSISFSGAGFLTVYHLGVAQCLLDNGLISLEPSKVDTKCGSTTNPLILTGVSGGALVSSALACGISPERGIETMFDVSRQARQQALNIYQPGYSLIDHVEHHLTLLFNTIDEDQLQTRIAGGRLRIGFTDALVFPFFGYNPKGYLYIDEFQTVADIVAACVLSSYVPGATGPLFTSHLANQPVQRSQEKIAKLAKQGAVKNFYGTSIAPVATISSPTFLDGGFVNVWPLVDDDTLIVTPLTALFPNHDHICPTFKDATFFPVNHYSHLALHYKNLSTLQDMIWSSNDEVLEQRFAQGYDNARGFLEGKSMLSSISVAPAGRSQAVEQIKSKDSS